MSKKYVVPFLVVICLAVYIPANAQIGIFVSPYGGYHHFQHRRQGPPPPPFEPYTTLSIGYGFPNLDKYELPGIGGLYQGNSTQMLGPLTASVDYRFERPLSIGIMVTHGTVDVPYYDDYTNAKQFTASLDNWSVMLDLINYFPVDSYNENVVAYTRLAAGVNIWNQSYTDPSGNNANVINVPSDFAYQVSLGAKFKLGNDASFFAEAGWGKYILQGGLSFKF
jgi:hypothetical protein